MAADVHRPQRSRLAWRHQALVATLGLMASPAVAPAAVPDFGPAEGRSDNVGLFGFAPPTDLALVDVLTTDNALDAIIPGGLFGNGQVVIRQRLAGSSFSIQSLSLGASAGRIAVSDATGDGFPDIVATAGAGARVARGSVGGSFSAANLVASGTTFNAGGIALGRLNADARPDLVVVGSSGDGGTAVFLNTLSPTVPFNSLTGFSSTAATDVALADLDVDGDLDAVSLTAASPGLAVQLGTGTGGFTSTPVLRNLFAAPSSLATGDLDGDGRPEAVVAVPSAHAVYVTELPGVGAPLDAWTVIPIEGTPADVAVADLDGDGLDEIVTANPSDNSVAVIRPGEAPVIYPAGVGPAHVAVGDFTADGRRDIVVANSDQFAWMVLPGRGTPRAAATPAASDLGSRVIGSIGGPTAVTISATDGAGLRLGTAALSGAAAEDFLLTDACSGRALDPGQTCTVLVRFAPSALGTRAATLTLGSNGGAVSIPLRGVGIDPPVATPTPAAVLQGTNTAATPTPAPSAAALSCKVVRVKGRARAGVDCKVTLTGPAAPTGFKVTLTKGKTTLATATAKPGGKLALRPKKALAKGTVRVALTVSTAGAPLTATQTLNVR